MSLDTPSHSPDNSADALLATAEKKAGLYAAYLRDSFDNHVCEPEDFCAQARWVLEDVNVQPEWFQADMKSPEWTGNVAHISEAVMRLQMACYPESEWGSKCDGLFGPGSWAALKHKAGEKSATSSARMKEAELRGDIEHMPPPIHHEIEGVPERRKNYDIVPLEPNKYVIIGDSLTEKKGGMSMSLRTVEYHGGQGTNSEQALAEVRKQLRENPDVYRGKNCSVAVGGNDFTNNWPTSRSMSNIRDMVETIQAAGGTVNVVIRLPYDQDVLTAGKGPEKAERMIKLHNDFRNEVYATYGSDGSVNIVDFATEFGVQRGDGRYVLRPDGPMQVKDRKYHVHPDPASYKVGAGFLSQELDALA